MIQQRSNLWDLYVGDNWIVVPTNIGWKRDGRNPMGAGIALQAAQRAPELPAWYGSLCKQFRDKTTVMPYVAARMFLFPTKPLNLYCPWMSWNNDSSLELIETSTKQLAKCVELCRSKIAIDKIILPMVGCGAGKLREQDVLPILEQLDDSYILVKYHHDRID